MLKIVISPGARRDIKGIWKYTLKEWGEAQANKYLENLDREIYRLLEFPDLGVPYEHIRKCYRALYV